MRVDHWPGDPEGGLREAGRQDEEEEEEREREGEVRRRGGVGTGGERSKRERGEAVYEIEGNVEEIEGRRSNRREEGLKHNEGKEEKERTRKHGKAGKRKAARGKGGIK